MKNNKDKANTLIKRKNLVSKIKKSGRRISPKAVSLLERYMQRDLINIIERLKEETTIKGRKTIKEEDINAVLSKEKEDSWEI